MIRRFSCIRKKKLKTKSKNEIEKKNLAKIIIQHHHSNVTTRPLRLAHNFPQQLSDQFAGIPWYPLITIQQNHRHNALSGENARKQVHSLQPLRFSEDGTIM
jgi:hypothetical protein